jgi:hypothetical protein
MAFSPGRGFQEKWAMLNFGTACLGNTADAKKLGVSCAYGVLLGLDDSNLNVRQREVDDITG